MAVSDIEVREIITTSVSDISAHITVAELIVSEELASSGLSAARLKEIERWLAAHFIAITDDANRLTSEKIGAAAGTYGGELGKSLEFTKYGQQVRILDTTGILASLGMDAISFKAFPIVT